jgi:hypothetical protein
VEALFFSALIKKDGDWYVARCMDLDVTSQGKTVVPLHDTLARGTLMDILRQAGLSKDEL